MNRFLGIVAYEYRMSIRRWAFWLAFGLVSLPYVLSISIPSSREAAHLTISELWQIVAEMNFRLNLFLPVVAGILISDRLIRDFKSGVSELQASTPISDNGYILSKYVGTLLSILTPAFILSLLFAVLSAIEFSQPVIILMSVVTFLAIVVPAYIFISSFSLALPVVIPLRVYQVLFTGYWFWGNFLSPKVFPTLNDTLLTPSGKFALAGFFGGMPGVFEQSSSSEAVLNLIILAACSAAVLLALRFYLNRQRVRG